MPSAFAGGLARLPSEIPTSSSRAGNTFLFLSLSLKPGNTLNNPFKNDAFSSRGLLAKLDGSRKLRVEIAREEK